MKVLQVQVLLQNFGTDHFNGQGHLVVDDTTKITRSSESSLVSGTKSKFLLQQLWREKNTNDLQRRLG